MNDPLKLAANTLNAQAPEGEQLAFINPMEALMLKEMGGSGKPAAGGVPSFKKGDVTHLLPVIMEKKLAIHWRRRFN